MADQNKDTKSGLVEFASLLNSELSFINAQGSGKDIFEKIFSKSYKVLHETVKEYDPDLTLLITPVGSSLIGNPSNQFIIEGIPFGIIGKKSKNSDNRNIINGILSYIGITNWFGISISDMIRSEIINHKVDNYNLGYIKVNETQSISLNISKNINVDLYFEVKLESKKGIKDKISELNGHILGELEKIEYKTYCECKCDINYNIDGTIFNKLKAILDTYLNDKVDLTKPKFTKSEDTKQMFIAANYSAFFKHTNLPLSYYFYSIPFIKSKSDEYQHYGNLVICANKDISANTELLAILQYFSLTLMSTFRLLYQLEVEEMLKKAQLKTAIISILVDSYAHNISAHSLSALKWWFELRAKMLDKRFKIESNGTTLKFLNPVNIPITPAKIQQTAIKFYGALDFLDGTYNDKYYSLLDFIQFADTNQARSMFSFSEKVFNSTGEQFNPRFPVPIDNILSPFFNFLRDKGAFWSGVTRDLSFGGESKTWYRILWDDFAKNPLYLGTIASTEGISKINIKLRVFNPGKETWEYGHFVTIDLSVLDYEKKMAESPTLDVSDSLIHTSFNIQSDELLTDDKLPKEIQSFDKSTYSPYAFVRLGAQFSAFKKILDDEEKFKVFLPGGVVGEHAMFTIFENTIRNIKHYCSAEITKIKNDGLDFWISIEPTDLLATSKKEKKELFNVGVWLGHESIITRKEKNEKGNVENKFLLIDVTNKSLEPILDNNTGTPKMGGNSQDKACAAMLFNNRFDSVQNNSGDRDKLFYPWITFTTASANSVDGESLKIVEGKIEQKSLRNYIIKWEKKPKGILKKYFNIWRADDIFLLKNDSDLKFENMSRFKFINIINTDDIIVNKLKLKAREEGAIRIVEGEIKVNEIYCHWLLKWINKAWENEKQILNLQHIGNDNNNDNYGSIVRINDTLKFIGKGRENKFWLQKYFTEDCATLSTAHGQVTAAIEDRCNARQHGYLNGNLFKEAKNLNEIKLMPIDTLNSFPNTSNGFKVSEFLETILTKISIFDNRVFERMPKNNKNEPKLLFKDQLNLSVFIESENDWPSNRLDIIDNNFLVIHLSFIEKLKDANGQSYTEERINDFIYDQILNGRNISDFNEKFILVITTGRGRGRWYDNLRPEYKLFTVFKPIESLLSAVENGAAYNDDIDIKYNLTKVLFGS